MNIYEWMGGCMDRYMNVWMGGCMDRHINVWMGGCMDRLYECMDG